jgi:hypothetical protein
MKLKTLIFLQESGPAGASSYPSMGMGFQSMSSQDSQLRPMPGGNNNAEDWNGIVEGDGWFLYKESNNWHNKQSTASITITEGEPTKFRIKIKTKGLKKKGDTNAKLYERVRQHTNRVSSAWISEAKKIYGNPELNEAGNPIQKSWHQCFKEALQSPKVSPFVEGIEESKWGSPIVNPVNF